ncbi:hypothetical protein PLANTIT3_20067 [Plantibacter sp. T3]|nr:hypothetical protein PLANTIT3_20067 [Plantibacter sp. T3]
MLRAQLMPPVKLFGLRAFSCYAGLLATCPLLAPGDDRAGYGYRKRQHHGTDSSDCGELIGPCHYMIQRRNH